MKQPLAADDVLALYDRFSQRLEDMYEYVKEEETGLHARIREFDEARLWQSETQRQESVRQQFEFIKRTAWAELAGLLAQFEMPATLDSLVRPLADYLSVAKVSLGTTFDWMALEHALTEVFPRSPAAQNAESAYQQARTPREPLQPESPPWPPGDTQIEDVLRFLGRETKRTDDVVRHMQTKRIPKRSVERLLQRERGRYFRQPRHGWWGAIRVLPPQNSR